MATIDFSDLHNYYEPLIYNYVLETVSVTEKIDDEELLKDLACLALNHLPARYVRHDVDMAFFLTSRERLAIQSAVVEAVDEALQQIRKSSQKA